MGLPVRIVSARACVPIAIIATIFSICTIPAMLACNVPVGGPPGPDLICGAAVAWVQNANTSANPNNCGLQVLCCPQNELVNADFDGANYRCCPVPNVVQAQNITTLPAAGVACAVDGLLGEYSPNYYQEQDGVFYLYDDGP